MENACVYEQTTVIHELTQGIEMAKQLRLNLNSAEAREFLINQILSSYDKALFVLKSGGQTRATPLPESSLPKSPISTSSPQSTEFEFDQNVVSKKRKASGPCEDEVIILTDENGLEGKNNDGYFWRKYGQKDILGSKFPRSYYKCSSYSKVQKCLATKQVKQTDENPKVFEIIYKGIHTCNNVAHSASPPPPSLEKHETKPTHHELPSSNSGEILSNLRANLSVNTRDMGGILPPSFSFPSSPFGFSDDDFKPINFPNHFDDELLLQGYSPSFMSPATSESNYLTEWGSSSSSLDFPTGSVDLYPDFEFNNTFLK